MSDWYEVRGQLVRRWTEGGKESCSYRNRRSHWDCDAPIAVIGNRERLTDNVTLCMRHAIDLFVPELGGAYAENLAEKAVREEILRNHWDEYQKLLDERLATLRAARLAALPDWLSPDTVTTHPKTQDVWVARTA